MKTYAITVDGRIFSRVTESELQSELESVKKAVSVARNTGSIGMLLRGNVGFYKIVK